jgi:cellulose synthase/poly-beta-1,6-N-acetylglucosamine synthase-like glycosyltransferase
MTEREWYRPMETFASDVVTILAILFAIPVAVFCVEIVAALALPQNLGRVRPAYGPRPRVAVLVPAHNESRGLLPTLADIHGQLHPRDRLLVVADNCVDDTAAIARAAGAEVIERRDPTKLGKGYALDYGVRHLGSDPPEFVIVIDADCRLADHAIDRLIYTCAETTRPAQALYLMRAPDQSRINHQVAEFAWRVKNWVRPLGLGALGLPCQLVGTGMAFPWQVLRNADLANGWIVEDLKLGLDLALAGQAPLFCPSAVVTSRFAASVKGARIQRSRWEQGHIDLILKVALPLLLTAIARRHWKLVALTLDLLVPPLSLLAILSFGVLALSAAVAFASLSCAPLAVSTASFLAFITAGILAWTNYGRDVVPFGAFFLIAPYILGKLGIYHQIASRKTDARWIRTDRTKSE